MDIAVKQSQSTKAAEAFRNYIETQITAEELSEALDDLYFVVSQSAMQYGIENIDIGKRPLSELMHHVHELKQQLR